jgi:DNA polymerase-3 subunit epsilon
LWLVLGGLLAAIWLVLGLAWWWQASHPGDAAGLALVLMVGALASAAAVGGLAVWLQRGLLRPLRSLQAAADVMNSANPQHSPEMPRGHLLGGLPGEVDQLGNALRDARRQVAAALATGAAQADQQRQRLEMVLREIPEGVVVCDADARVLLYNPAAQRILDDPQALGLGRSLFAVFEEQPVRHMLDTRFHAASASGQASENRFICGQKGQDRFLRCRLGRIEAEPGEAGSGSGGGFILVFRDVTGALSGRRQQAAGLQHALLELRARVAALPEAGKVLGEALERVQNEGRALAGRPWLSSEMHSSDLARVVALQLGPDRPLSETGVPVWLRANSHAVASALALLAKSLPLPAGEGCDLETGPGEARVAISLVWRGEPLSEEEIVQLCRTALVEVAGTPKVGEVMRAHGAVLLSSRHRRSGYAQLGFSLETAEAPEQRKDLPPRPEFYDFDLAAPEVEAELRERRLLDLGFVVFDSETTGLRPSDGDELVALAGVRVVNGRVLGGESFDQLINPGRSIPASSIRFHGITDEVVRDQPPAEIVLPRFREFVGDQVLVAYNAAFDMRFLERKQVAAGVRFDDCPVLDILLISVFLHGDALEDHSLDGIAKRYGVHAADRHSALGDSLTTAQVFVRLLDVLARRGITTLGEVLDASEQVVEIRRQQAQF